MGRAERDTLALQAREAHDGPLYVQRAVFLAGLAPLVRTNENEWDIYFMNGSDISGYVRSYGHTEAEAVTRAKDSVSVRDDGPWMIRGAWPV